MRKVEISKTNTESTQNTQTRYARKGFPGVYKYNKGVVGVPEYERWMTWMRGGGIADQCTVGGGQGLSKLNGTQTPAWCALAGGAASAVGTYMATLVVS
jgi:hypothetical protein